MCMNILGNLIDIEIIKKLFDNVIVPEISISSTPARSNTQSSSNSCSICNSDRGERNISKEQQEQYEKYPVHDKKHRKISKR